MKDLTCSKIIAISLGLSQWQLRKKWNSKPKGKERWNKNYEMGTKDGGVK